MTSKKTGTKVNVEQVDIMNEINRVPMTQESRERMSLNIYDLQYLIRLQDMSNDSFREELKEIYIKDNTELCKSVTDIVCKQLSETLAPWSDTLQRLEKGQKEIATTLEEMKIRLGEVEDRVYVDDNKRLIKLERYASVKWTIIRNVITAIIAIGISILAFFQIHNNLR